MDALGHLESIKSMITGTLQADCRSHYRRSDARACFACNYPWYQAGDLQLQHGQPSRRILSLALDRHVPHFHQVRQAVDKDR
ncbi:hypothetical protein V6N13_137371 [Hibiscus sabdariffa]|uniref:Uncharacterized protein n=1 Tax=Hibiscus sabdariffa TaxID=183260 RepID=A0ABR2DKV0_9ROSI